MTAPTAVRRRRRLPLLVLVAVALTGAGCRVRTDVDIQVDRNGSGTVAVRVLLDREAAAQVPDLGSQLRVADLRRAGWRVDGPHATTGGGLRVSARKRFGGPARAGAVLQELAGLKGPFHGFTVTRAHSFAQTSWTTRGTVDLSEGLAAFSDQRLTALLGGKPFGRSEQELTFLAHGSVADAAPFRVQVRLPGAAARTYLVRLGSAPLPIDVVSRETSSRAYVLGGGAVVALLAAGVLFVLGRRPRRRAPRAERGMGAYDRRQYEPIRDTEHGPAPGSGGAPQLVRVRRPAPRRPPNAPSSGSAPRAEDEGRRPTRPPGPRPPRPRRPPDR